MSVVLRIHLDELRQTIELDFAADVKHGPVSLDVIVLHPKNFPSHRFVRRNPLSVLRLPLSLYGEHI